MGGVIDSVDPLGTGVELGLAPGDEIISVNGVPPTDEIDYRYAIAEDHVTLLVRRASGEIVQFDIEKDPDDTLGIQFASPVFDGVRECKCRCVFCFVDQMPPGARRSTLIHDDDYRLSFLGGNFVTLTNLTDSDVRRIVAQRLSPLYVSVHATDPRVRRRLFRSRHAERGIEVLEKLLAHRIEVHAQIVVVPGYNDGEVLDETVRYLAARHPGVRSIGIVPVGLTTHRRNLPVVQPVSPELARDILGQVRRWQAESLPRLGTRLCFAADELYLLAGEPFPEEAEYEDYPQEENGIGMCVPFLAELRRELGRARRGNKRGRGPRTRRGPPSPPAPLPKERGARARRGRGEGNGSHPPRHSGSDPDVVILSGTRAGPLIADVIHSCGLGDSVRVVPVPNTYLGASVTVAGLLAGRDLLAAMGASGPTLFICPEVALNDQGLFVDDLSLGELQARAEEGGGLLKVAGSAAELASLVAWGWDAE